MRRRALDTIGREPWPVQARTLTRLVACARHTAFGRSHAFVDIRSVGDYRRRVPLRDHGAFCPFLERAWEGEPDVTWPGLVRDWVKTSGTTLDRLGPDARVGDLSGLVLRRLPPGLRGRYSPGRDVAAIPDWPTRLERAAHRVAGQDLRMISGMPSWVLLLLERVSRLPATVGRRAARRPRWLVEFRTPARSPG
jgi:hypothetical protein